jgi:hypothetical protein
VPGKGLVLQDQRYAVGMAVQSGADLGLGRPRAVDMKGRFLFLVVVVKC